MCETKLSPRIEEGVIVWYSGDSFPLEISLYDEEMNKPILIDKNEMLTLVIRDGCRNILKIDLNHVGEGNYSFSISKENTKKLSVGEYSYDIIYYKKNNEIQTIYTCGKMRVEGVCQC